MIFLIGRFYLGNGYYTYTFDDEKLVRNEVISFPIIQSGKIVLLLNVGGADDTWSGTGTAQFIDELNENTGINDIPTIVYYKDNGYLVKENKLICLDSAVREEDLLHYETIKEAFLKMFESSTSELNLENGLTELGYIEKSIGNEPASTRKRSWIGYRYKYM